MSVSCPQTFRFIGLGVAQEPAFLASSQVTLTLLASGNHCFARCIRIWDPPLADNLGESLSHCFPMNKTRVGSWWARSRGNNRRIVGGQVPCNCGLEAPADTAPASVSENQGAGTLLLGGPPFGWLWWRFGRLGWCAHACVRVCAPVSMSTRTCPPARQNAGTVFRGCDPADRKHFTCYFVPEGKENRTKPAPKRIPSERLALLGLLLPGDRVTRAPAPAGASARSFGVNRTISI